MAKNDREHETVALTCILGFVVIGVILAVVLAPGTTPFGAVCDLGPADFTCPSQKVSIELGFEFSDPFRCWFNASGALYCVGVFFAPNLTEFYSETPVGPLEPFDGATPERSGMSISLALFAETVCVLTEAGGVICWGGIGAAGRGLERMVAECDLTCLRRRDLPEGDNTTIPGDGDGDGDPGPRCAGPLDAWDWHGPRNSSSLGLPRQRCSMIEVLRQHKAAAHGDGDGLLHRRNGCDLCIEHFTEWDYVEGLDAGARNATTNKTRLLPPEARRAVDLVSTAWGFCAIRECDGQTVCWGLNVNRVADPTATHTSVPPSGIAFGLPTFLVDEPRTITVCPGLGTVDNTTCLRTGGPWARGLGALWQTVCAVNSDWEAVCWGVNVTHPNALGQPDVDFNEDVLLPNTCAPLFGLDGHDAEHQVVDLDGRGGFTLAFVTANGTARSWTFFYTCQLGGLHTTPLDQSGFPQLITAQRVENGAAVAKVSADYLWLGGIAFTTCDGELYTTRLPGSGSTGSGAAPPPVQGDYKPTADEACISPSNGDVACACAPVRVLKEITSGAWCTPSEHWFHTEGEFTTDADEPFVGEPMGAAAVDTAGAAFEFGAPFAFDVASLPQRLVPVPFLVDGEETNPAASLYVPMCALEQCPEWMPVCHV